MMRSFMIFVGALLFVFPRYAGAAVEVGGLRARSERTVAGMIRGMSPQERVAFGLELAGFDDSREFASAPALGDSLVAGLTDDSLIARLSPRLSQKISSLASVDEQSHLMADLSAMILRLHTRSPQIDRERLAAMADALAGRSRGAEAIPTAAPAGDSRLERGTLSGLVRAPLPADPVPAKKSSLNRLVFAIGTYSDHWDSYAMGAGTAGAAIGAIVGWATHAGVGFGAFVGGVAGLAVFILPVMAAGVALLVVVIPVAWMLGGAFDVAGALAEWKASRAQGAARRSLRQFLKDGFGASIEVAVWYLDKWDTASGALTGAGIVIGGLLGLLGAPGFEEGFAFGLFTGGMAGLIASLALLIAALAVVVMAGIAYIAFMAACAALGIKLKF